MGWACEQQGNVDSCGLQLLFEQGCVIVLPRDGRQGHLPLELGQTAGDVASDTADIAAEGSGIGLSRFQTRSRPADAIDMGTANERKYQV